MASVGGGVKLRLSQRMWLRLDIHDYLTPFPANIITPAAGSSVGGWINNFVGTGESCLRSEHNVKVRSFTTTIFLAVAAWSQTGPSQTPPNPSSSAICRQRSL